MNKVITIDGLSTNGKSTLALKIANCLNFKYLNTGSIYRSIVYYILKNDLDVKDEDLAEQIKNIKIEFSSDKTYLNGVDISKEIRTEEISYYSSYWAQVKAIRDYANDFQQSYLEKNDVVIEGRDTGSRICPRADVKFYLYCDFDTRLKRLEKLKPEIDKDVLKKDLEEVDRLDIELKSLNIPQDAIKIDTTKYSLEEVFEIMIEEIKKRI